MSDPSKVVLFPGITTLDLPPDRLLENAVGQLTEVIILGYDKDGKFYFSSSKASGPEALWTLAMAQKKILEVFDDD